MTLKKILLIPLAISLLFFVYYSGRIATSLSVALDSIQVTPAFVVAMTIAIVLQFGGHVIRAYKTKYILKPVKESTWRFQFRALSLGYLFNALWPFRLGELIRAYVMAVGDKISFGLTFLVVVFERSFDAALLLIISLLLFAFGWLSFSSIEVFIAILGVFTLVVLIGFVLLTKEYRPVLRLVHTTTGLLNERLKQSVRFRVWSIIYGLQRILRGRALGAYVALTLLSWLFYGASMLVIANQVLGSNQTAKNTTLATISPYYGVSLPAGPANLGAYSASADKINGRVISVDSDRITFTVLTWAVFVVPMSIVGLVLLLTKTKEPFARNLSTVASSEAFIHKLQRNEDISGEMATFLDNYFSGNALSGIVHRLERTDKFRLLRYFKGGSDAITVLAAEKDGEIVVKKIISIEYIDRLRAQYRWLRKHGGKGIVRALGDQVGPDYYSIDLHYSQDDEMFFDYMHHNSITASQAIIDKVWDHLGNTLYNKTQKATDYRALDAYVDKHIYGCLEKAIVANADIELACTYKKITINGKKYDNVHTILKKIMNDKNARKDLATYSQSEEVHGDVAVDNILVSKRTRRPLLIDPAPDGNIIVGPVFDFGKNMQSLYCGYEFLLRSKEPVVLGSGGIINFQDRRSEQYVQLCEYVRQEVAPKYLSDGEQRAVLFHAGALHIRRLKHQVYQDPSIALAVYATGVKALNDFYQQYKTIQSRTK